MSQRVLCCCLPSAARRRARSLWCCTSCSRLAAPRSGTWCTCRRLRPSVLIPTFLDEALFDEELEVAVDEQSRGGASRWEQEECERQRAFDQEARGCWPLRCLRPLPGGERKRGNGLFLLVVRTLPSQATCKGSDHITAALVKLQQSLLQTAVLPNQRPASAMNTFRLPSFSRMQVPRATSLMWESPKPKPARVAMST